MEKTALVTFLAFLTTTAVVMNNGENSANLRTNPVSQWEQFKTDYGMKFDTVEEESYRQSIFLENVKYIEEFNASHDSVKLGINQLAMLSNDEFRSRFLNKEETTHRQLSQLDLTEDFHATEGELQLAIGSAPLPSNWNWLNYGAVTAPMSQGQCGSSWALSAKDGLESLYYLKKGTLVELSAQQILDCEPHGKGCSGGNPGNAWLYTKSDGIQTESSYKYTGTDGECAFSSADVVFKNEKSMRVKIQSPTSAMKYVLEQPLSVGVDASTQAFQFYKEGVFSSTDCGVDINLAVTLIGYNDVANKPYWIIKNNWGNTWGSGGFAKLEKALGNEATKGTCGILVDPTFPSGVKTM